MSAWSASRRHQLASAPGGLGLVQDFLNTAAVGHHPDLLTDAALARDWATAALRTWSDLRGVRTQAPELQEADLTKLRSLREAIARLIAGEPPTGRETAASSVTFALADTGEVRLEPAGSGWHWLASALWSEILLSQQDGSWRRVKRCHNHLCTSTFYDRSKNNSGVWHNVKTCGNAANLRASRARRREREQATETGG